MAQEKFSSTRRSAKRVIRQGICELPKLLERVGKVQGKGTITGIYTVLVEGGDMDEPITDAIRAISDGHIQLSRELAARNHCPAIDILNSISRVVIRLSLESIELSQAL